VNHIVFIERIDLLEREAMGLCILSDNGLGFPLVANFFEYEGTDKEKRYKRFKNEIIALNELKDIDGIMQVLDKNCPQDIPRTEMV
jgi:hypothetical protein